MLRYLRLYAHFVKFSLSKAMEFRVDFFFRIVMDCVYYAVNLAFFKILYLHTDSLGGWSESDTMVFVGTYLFVDAVQMTVLSSNMWMMPVYINRGDLDYYLVRPVSSLFILAFREFSFNSFINLLFASGILIWAFLNFEGAITYSQFALYGLAIFCGLLIYFSVSLLFVLPVFWTGSPRGLSTLFHPMLRFMERPDTVFSGWTRKVLVSLLPLALIASFPARVIIDGPSFSLLAHILSVTFVFMASMLLIWHVALKKYSSASS